MLVAIFNVSQEAQSRMSKLQTTDFLKLTNWDAEEISPMVQLATDDGFFYLDLRGWKDGQLIGSLNVCAWYRGWMVQEGQ